MNQDYWENHAPFIEMNFNSKFGMVIERWYERKYELQALQYARKLKTENNLKNCVFHPFTEQWIVSQKL